MKLRSIAYGAYLGITVLLSITIAAIPAIATILIAYEHVDFQLNRIGWPFVDIENFVQAVMGEILPQIVYDRFWFIVMLPTIFFVCYGIFLTLLAIMFRISRRGIP
ncbi:MAG: hypothetical protein ACFFD6_10740, partial [Candidatus Thorarchaeota archaeon]